jgi:hypothetical protein
MVGMRAAEIDRSFAPQRAAAAYTVELDGEAVVLDEAQNRLHHLNPMATLVWSCFDGSGTIDEIAVDLASAFASVPDVVAVDVLKLAQELGSEGLLAGVDQDGSELEAKGCPE